MILCFLVFTCFSHYITAYPYPYPFPFPYPGIQDDPGSRCCVPQPGCTNPCGMQPPPQAPPMMMQPPPMMLPPPPPPPMMMMAPPPPPPPQPCCMPAPTCMNPCQAQGQPPPSMAYQRGPKQPVVYAPLPGEIVFKLLENWDVDLLDSTSPSYQILEGNIRSAVQAVLGPSTQVTNIYFREGYVPGNPPTRPKTVAHMMVNGGSDAASLLEHAVSPDGSLGDGLKVYRDSFNAY